MTFFEKEMSFLEKIIQKAIQISIWFEKFGFKTLKKSDTSPVTTADYAIQIFINNEINKNFPNDQIIAEESSNQNLVIANDLILKCYKELSIRIRSDLNDLLDYKGKRGSRKWTVDPIDGTIGFSKGLSYAIGISFLLVMGR